MNTTPLPQAPESEEAIICAAASNPDLIPKIRAEGIDRHSFIVPQNGELWEICSSRYDEKKPIGLISLTEALRESKALDRIGGASRLVSLTSGHVPDYQIPRLCATLREKQALRTMISAALEATQDAYSSHDPSEIVKALRLAAEEGAKNLTGRKRSKPSKDLLRGWLDSWKDRQSTPSRFETGLWGLDVALGGGLTRNGLTVIAGATGAGKTALALQIAVNAGKRGARIAFVSLEMSDLEIADRLIANLGNVPMGVVSNPSGQEITVGNQEGIEKAVRSLLRSDVHFTDVTVTGMTDIDDEIRMLHAEKPVDLVVVDYLQLIDGHRGARESREREVASISRGLHLLGMQLGCVMIAMSQLNDDGKMRESRAISQDAKTLLDVRDDGIMILKNRQGPGKDELVKLTLRGVFQRFE